MSDSISYAGAFVALALPWVVGAILVLGLVRPTGRWNWSIVLGQGYLAGVLAITTLIRVWAALGLPLQFWSITLVIMVFCGAGSVLLTRNVPPPGSRGTTLSMPAWQIVVVAILLVLIAVRYGTLAQEVYLRPLFPWDAWMNWAPKPLVWFHFGELMQWVSAGDWLTADGDTPVFTAGAGNVWAYPELIPLLQYWGMLGLGVDDHTLIYFPWLFVAMALGAALYGHLRLFGLGIPAALLASYALLSLPFISVHVALAGYADIWVAAFFGCATFCLAHWQQYRSRRYAALAIFMALGCTQAKIPGLVMAGIIILVLVITLMRSARLWMATLLASALLLSFLVIWGVDYDIPTIGRVYIGLDKIQLPYIGSYSLQFHPVQNAMVQTLYVMNNWNILMYLVSVAFVLLCFKPKILKPLATEVVINLAAISFIFFVYFMTNSYKFAIDFTQVNRALIYCVAPMVFLIARLLAALARLDQSAEAEKSSANAPG